MAAVRILAFGNIHSCSHIAFSLYSVASNVWTAGAGAIRRSSHCQSTAVGLCGRYGDPSISAKMLFCLWSIMVRDLYRSPNNLGLVWLVCGFPAVYGAAEATFVDWRCLAAHVWEPDAAVQNSCSCSAWTE